MSTVEYVCAFARASGDRLRAAELLVLALPRLLDHALQECDLRYQSQVKLLGLFVRLEGEGLAQAKRDRLTFWTARAGGRAMAIDTMSDGDRARITTYLARSDHERVHLTPAALFDASGEFFTGLGVAPDRRRAAGGRPRLVMDVGGPGWDGVRWNAGESRLFVAAPLAPPVGDQIPLFLRIPGGERPVETRSIVVEVRPAAAAGPGAPAGYTLRLESLAPTLAEALSRAGVPPEDETRAAPRFQVKAPVKVTHALQLEDEAPPPRPARTPAAPEPSPRAARTAAGPAHAVIEYATDQELAADYVENLSHGGAFVRTASPPPVDTPLVLDLKLPNGAELHARAMVAFVNEKGMGVRFQLTPENEAVLASAMAHISARPRRALVVDDDQLVCNLLADALRTRGFEVLGCTSAVEGLSTLSDEILALDLLVTDLVMPEMDGEEFVRLIRRTGGETDLAIVCMTGHLGEGLEERLEKAGADAVLDKALGPELIAQAADAVLERKRLVGQDG